jgi:hypothetical protein
MYTPGRKFYNQVQSEQTVLNLLYKKCSKYSTFNNVRKLAQNVKQQRISVFCVTSSST